MQTDLLTSSSPSSYPKHWKLSTHLRIGPAPTAAIRSQTVVSQRNSSSCTEAALLLWTSTRPVLFVFCSGSACFFFFLQRLSNPVLHELCSASACYSCTVDRSWAFGRHLCRSQNSIFLHPFVDTLLLLVCHVHIIVVCVGGTKL